MSLGILFFTMKEADDLLAKIANTLEITSDYITNGTSIISQ